MAEREHEISLPLEPFQRCSSITVADGLLDISNVEMGLKDAIFAQFGYAVQGNRLDVVSLQPSEVTTICQLISGAQGARRTGGIKAHMEGGKKVYVIEGELPKQIQESSVLRTMLDDDEEDDFSGAPEDEAPDCPAPAPVLAPSIEAPAPGQPPLSAEEERILAENDHIVV